MYRRRAQLLLFLLLYDVGVAMTSLHCADIVADIQRRRRLRFRFWKLPAVTLNYSAVPCTQVVPKRLPVCPLVIPFQYWEIENTTSRPTLSRPRA